MFQTVFLHGRSLLLRQLSVTGFQGKRKLSGHVLLPSVQSAVSFLALPAAAVQI